VVEGNGEIWEILTLASTQWRVGMGGAYGLDYGVVMEMAKALGIRRDQTFFEKVRVVEAEVLRIWDEQRKKKTAHESDEEYQASMERVKGED